MPTAPNARFIGGCALLLSLAASCARPAPKPLSLEGRTMGTVYHVTVARRRFTRPEAAELHAAVDRRLREINALMSTYDQDSELSRFNARRGREPFPVSAQTLEVVKAALRFHESSGGAFDATVGPLVELWGFGARGRNTAPPGEAAVREALQAVGSRNLRVQEKPPALAKMIPALRLDLSAVAKGYGVDAVARLLSERGCRDFMVEIGGEVYAEGRSPRGGAWRIGIDTPDEGAPPGESLSGVVGLDGRGLATSGDYRNYFRYRGRLYSHIIDPRTGRPVSHRLASASVIAPTCMEADAAATALMVLGPEKGLRWAEGMEGFEALLIAAEEDGTFSRSATSGFRGYLQSP